MVPLIRNKTHYLTPTPKKSSLLSLVLSSTMSSSFDSNHRPLREIPGSYDLPFFEPIMDRHNYFYHEGHDKLFSSRISHNSTVIRTNMSSGPFISSDPRVIALLDGPLFLYCSTTIMSRSSTPSISLSCFPPSSTTASASVPTSTDGAQPRIHQGLLPLSSHPTKRLLSPAFLGVVTTFPNIDM